MIEPKEHEESFRFVGTQRINYLEGLVSKQLDLYTWCEEKVTTLATIDSILLAGATLFVVSVKSGIFSNRVSNTTLNAFLNFQERNFTFTMVLLMILPVFISLGITLWHVIPKMNSRATPSHVHNHRTVNGIRKNRDIQEYKELIDKITEDEIYHDLVRQVYGMNKNIWKNQKSIKTAVFFDLIGMCGFLYIIFYLVINGNKPMFS